MSSDTHEFEQEIDHQASHSHTHTDTTATHSFYVTTMETQETPSAASMDEGERTFKSTKDAAAAMRSTIDHHEPFATIEDCSCDSPSPTRVSQLHIAASEEEVEEESSTWHHNLDREEKPLTVTSTTFASSKAATEPLLHEVTSSTSHIEEQKDETDDTAAPTDLKRKEESQEDPGPHLDNRFASSASSAKKPLTLKKKQRIQIRLVQNTMTFLDTFAVEVDERLTKVSDKIDNLETKIHLLELSEERRTGEEGGVKGEEQDKSSPSPSSESPPLGQSVGCCTLI